MRSCATAVGIGAIVVVALALFGWLARDDIVRFVARGAGEGDSTAMAVAAGPELADEVEAKVIALGQGESSETTLSTTELNAWIRYRLEGFFPSYISDVSTAIEEQRLVLSGRVALKEVPDIGQMGPAVTLFGDTALVVVRGELDGLTKGRGIYYVDEVRVGVVPLPDAMRDQLLARLKGGEQDGVPSNAVAFLLPDFVTDVGVREDRVVLRRE
ncbi:MAG: hypothetical protein PVI01_18020 [Gemmatimonadales bacterium]|jgi:hypothetical protein